MAESQSEEANIPKKKQKTYDDDELTEKSSDGNQNHQTNDPTHVTVHLKFIDQMRREFFVKVKPTLKLGKVFETYCSRYGFTVGGPRFFHNGNKLNRSHTAADMGMEDGDEIEVFTEMDGGGTDGSSYFTSS